MRILLVYNGFLYPDEPPYLVECYKNACEKLNFEFEVRKNTQFLVENFEIERITADLVLFYDKDLPLARAMQKQCRLLNSASSIEVCDDKLLQLEVLANCMQIIPTISAPKCFHKGKTNDFLRNVAQKLEFPLIIKERNGSYGGQVYLANDMNEFERIYSEHSDKQLIFQKFIASSYGKDIRIFVAFGKVIGAVLRVAKSGEFRSNCELGATAYEYQPCEAEVQLALDASKALGLQVCGVDLLLAENGKRIVCEVNANAGFLHMQKVLNLDFALQILLEYDKNIRK